MQLESLQVFYDVVRLQSFSLGAVENHLSQSAASQIVQQLEKRLGVPLIDRSARPLKPTPQGRAYAAGCRTLIERYHELEAAIRNGAHEPATNVRVAAIYSVGLGDMGEHVEQFSKEHPEAKVHIEYLHPDRVYEKVLDGSADLGLVSFPKTSRELTVFDWREEPMVLACLPSHPLAGHAAIRPSQLNGEKYVGFDKHLVIRREVDRYLRRNKVAVDVGLEFDNVETIKKAVEVSAGVALLPEPTFRREVESGTLAAVPLSGRPLVRPLGILHRRQNKLSEPALRFIELLQRPVPMPPPAKLNARTPGMRSRLPRKG